MVNLAIETLFFTNVWIYTYTRVLDIFRFVFPVKPADEFLMLGVSPEPFEIPLYILFTLLIILIIFFLHKKMPNSIQKINTFTQYTVLVLLAFLFFYNLGGYPLKDTQFNLLNGPYLIIYLIALATIAAEIIILEKILNKVSFKNVILYLGIVLTLGLITFPPRFSISGIDYSYFFGPIWEIAHGKTIYTEISSQYGFLSILFLTFFYKLKLLSLSYLPVFIWILLLVQYFVCFYLIYKQSKSLTIALLGLFSILTVNYFTVRVVPTDYPQSGPLRWLPLIMSLFFLQKSKDITLYKLIVFIALASFWMIDSGIELLLAYFLSISILFITKHLSVKKLIISLSLLFFSLFTIFFLTQTAHVLLGYKLINFLAIFTKLRQYAKSGFGMVPIEAKNYFWIGILFYFASIIYFIRNTKQTVDDRGWKIDKEARGSRIEKFNLLSSIFKFQPSTFYSLPSSNLQLLLFSANLMFFASIYYIGRSHPAELYTISLFIILNIFLFLGVIYRQISNVKSRIILLVIIVILFIILPVYNRTEALSQSMQIRVKRLLSGNIFNPEMDELLLKKYQKEIPMIKHEIPQEEILIVSGDDTYLLYLTDKKTLLSDNSLVNILTKQDLANSTKKAKKVCPEKIAGECRLFKSCHGSELFSKAFYAWQPIVLKEVETGCQVKYKPVWCTHQLCIAQAEKL